MPRQCGSWTALELHRCTGAPVPRGQLYPQLPVILSKILCAVAVLTQAERCTEECRHELPINICFSAPTPAIPSVSTDLQGIILGNEKDVGKEKAWAKKSCKGTFPVIGRTEFVNGPTAAAPGACILFPVHHLVLHVCHKPRPRSRRRQ